MMAVSDFSGLASSAWALASAAARAPMVSLDRCMIGSLQEVKAHGAGLGATGADAMPAGLFGVGWDQFLELGLGGLAFAHSRPGATVNFCKDGPRVGASHLAHPNGFQPGGRWLDPKQMRWFATLNAAPELFLSG